MIYDPATREPLRSWLVKTLEPICDADPGALAEYVLALLEHDAPEYELRNEFVSQLEEFLEKRSSDFVNSLFSALRSKSYIPYSSSSDTRLSADSTHIRADTGIPIPLDALLASPSSALERGAKRSLEQDGDDGRGPPKGPRYNDNSLVSRYAVSNGHTQAHESWGKPILNDAFTSGLNAEGVGEFHDLKGSVKNPRSKHNFKHGSLENSPRGACRDYHIKGYCARGSFCKYSHDDAAVAPGQVSFSGPAPNTYGTPTPAMFLSLYANSSSIPGNDVSQSVAYDPHEAFMDMNSGPNKMIDPFFLSMYNAQAEQQHLRHNPGQPTSRVDASTSALQGTSDYTEPVSPYRALDSNATFSLPLKDDADGATMALSPGMDADATPAINEDLIFHERLQLGDDGQRFSKPQASRPSRLRETKTLVVEKIPDDSLSLEAVNNWFKRFGTVTNVAVDVVSAKALVSFLTHEEARLAWKAEEAIFNNRFVKVYWHRPLEGKGVTGVRKLQSSAPLVANLAGRNSGLLERGSTGDLKSSDISLSSRSAQNKASKMVFEKPSLAARQHLLDKLINEHKLLMSQFDAAGAEEKKKILDRLRQLSEEQKSIISESKSLAEAGSQISYAAESQPGEQLKSVSQSSGELERNGGSETRDALQAKLVELRAEANALGISDTHVHRPTRNFRGRGRPRPFGATNRGRSRRFNMSLDNRSKSLRLKGLNAADPAVAAALKSWYEIDGHLRTVEVLDETSAVVHFMNRNTAEQAISKGSKIPAIGDLHVSWYQATGNTTENAKDFIADDSKPLSAQERAPSPRLEEVLDESGWGDPDEDGMGML